MKLRAEGLCRFHFWGDYYQSFILVFEDAEFAVEALPVLRRVAPPSSADGWIMDGRRAGIMVKGADVAAVEAQLVAFGADPEKISSLAHSVDHGEPFEVTIEVEDPAQTLIPLS